MDKGGLTALAIMGGFFVLAYFIREGLSVVKAYSTSKENERAELIQFIKNTQAKQDSSEMSFMSYCNNMTQILSSVATRIEEGQRTSDIKHNELLSRLGRRFLGIWRLARRHLARRHLGRRLYVGQHQSKISKGRKKRREV